MTKDTRTKKDLYDHIEALEAQLKPFLRLREPVLVFALKMEDALKKHDEDRGVTGWRPFQLGITQTLFDRLHDEIQEAEVAYSNFDPKALVKELTDVANFCMMIVDRIHYIGVLK